MNFEINLPERSAQYLLGTAGISTRHYSDAWWKVFEKKAALPVEVSCRYFLSDTPMNVRVTVFAYKPATHLKIEVEDEATGKKIREHLNRLSVENKGGAADDQEHKKLWARIKEILHREGISYNDWQGGALLPRHAMESLMELCETTEWYRRSNIHGLFTGHAVAKADRLFAARWLIKLLETDRDPNSQIGVRIWELAVPQIANDLIRLIQDRRHGENRGVLCLALAKTKHPQAAEVIASVLGEEGMTRWALEALGKLKAAEHADAVRKFLHDSNTDIRREAKKTLKKMGAPIEIPPRAIHLVKNRRLLPAGLDEWSTNLDIEDLQPALEAVAKCVESGFGHREIAEVAGVVDEMEQDQTKAFRFPISANRQKSEVWLVIFMDDIDSPDLEIHAGPELIQKLGKALPQRD
jgi:hypothetical protein